MVIPSLHNIAVVLDTSALSNIIQDDPSVERFVKTVLRRQSVTVLVPRMVLFEWSSNADVQKVFEQILRLQRLCRELGAQFCHSLDHEELMGAETAQWLRGPPVHKLGVTERPG